MSKLKYIYGPVSSWRLKRSLGIDLISGEKHCTFDCIYCQLGRAEHSAANRILFVPTRDIISEFEHLPKVRYDYVTFSGCGEPTLAANLGEVISEIRKRTKAKIAVLTNSTLMSDRKVRAELGLADIVVAKLDAPNENVFKAINHPAPGITLKKVVAGIKKFNREYPGKLALQLMFVQKNRGHADALLALVKSIRPVEVQINTPLRPSGAKPLTPRELLKIKKLFSVTGEGEYKVYCVYDVNRPAIRSIDKKATRKRRGE